MVKVKGLYKYVYLKKIYMHKIELFEIKFILHVKYLLKCIFLKICIKKSKIRNKTSVKSGSESNIYKVKSWNHPDRSLGAFVILFFSHWAVDV